MGHEMDFTAEAKLAKGQSLFTFQKRIPRYQNNCDILLTFDIQGPIAYV